MNISEHIEYLLPLLLRGTLNSILVFFSTLLIALPLGLPFTLMSNSRIYPLKWLSDLYIWIFRGTPLMLQLFFIYYILPFAFPAANHLDSMTCAIITFGLNYSAYFAEIYRGGINSIDKGQYEAAKTLGFTKWKTMIHIIIPQTISRVVPAISNEAITLIKDTALIYVISGTELMKVAKDDVNDTGDPLAYLFAAIIYLLMTVVLTFVSKKVETRFSKHEVR